MSKARYFGCHVSSSGGIENGIKNGENLKVNTIQIHPSPPQRWNSKPYPVGYEEAFVEAKKQSCVEKVFFHAIYLINLATPNPQHFHLSKLSLVHYLDLNARIGGEGVIVHVGSLKDEPNEEVGLKRAAEGISWVLENSPKESTLLLEVAAGAGMVVGDTLEDLSTIAKLVGDDKRLGFALDTQHLWASGYDYKSDLEAFVNKVGSEFGFDRIGAIHLNDSKTELGSRKDRHENLGDGLIGIESLTKFVNHPKFKSIPFILETPGLKSEEGAKIEVEKLRSIVT